MRIWIAAAMLIAETTLIAACAADRPPAPTPPFAAANDWDGDWTFRFSRSYPPGNQPPKQPPINPPEAVITFSITVTEGRVSGFYSKTEDPAGTTWGDAVARPGATAITTRVWQTCEVERRPFPNTSARTLVEDILGSIIVPPDAVGTTAGTFEWTRTEGVTEARVTQIGEHWSHRRIQHYLPEQDKLLYTIDDIMAEPSDRSATEFIDLADDAYQRNCA